MTEARAGIATARTLVGLAIAAVCACGTEPPPPVHIRTEDCSNGIDDDADGLLDCEDGDCAAAGVCREVCDNAADDDVDGLVDCDDDECWGAEPCLPCAGLECHPEGVRVRVLRGRAELRSRRVVSSSVSEYTTPCASGTSPCSYAVGASTRTGTLSLAGVGGVVSVLPPGGRWSTAAVPTMCSWSFSAGEMAFRRHRTWVGDGVFETSELGPVARSGMDVEPGCRLSGTSFLPAELWPVFPALYLVEERNGYRYSGAPWYVGELALLTTSTTVDDQRPTSFRSTFVGTAVMEPVVQDGSMLVLPP